MTTTTTPAPPMSMSRYAVAVGNEVTKGLRHAWAERVQIIIELPLFASFVLLISLLLGRGEQVVATGRLPWHFDPQKSTWLFLGFVIFTFVYLQSVKTFWRLLAEIQTGTLEQNYLSPIPAWVNIAVGRVLAAVVETAIVVGVLYAVTSLAVDLQLTWRADALAPLGFAVLGGAGYSLMIAGLTLAWKRVELLQELVLVVIMFISGAILPLSGMLGWATGVANLVFITHPIEAIRATMLHDQPIQVWGTGGWVWLTGTAVAWLALGVLAFTIGSRYATRHGSLTRY